LTIPVNTATHTTEVPEMQLTAAQFAEAGGLKAAINKQSEKVFESFPEEQVAIRRLFQRLTDQREGDRPVRNPETLRVLKGVTGLTAARLARIVKFFVENGLLVTRPVEDNEIEVDLPHECIAWKWERLKGWIEEEIADAKSLRLLRDSAANRQWLVGSLLTEAKNCALMADWTEHGRGDTSRIRIWRALRVGLQKASNAMKPNSRGYEESADVPGSRRWPQD
jgi:hypothetical protein